MQTDCVFYLADLGFFEGVTLETWRELIEGIWAYGRILYICELSRGFYIKRLNESL